MNDFQVYLIAQQRIDQLEAEAMALGHGPGFRADSPIVTPIVRAGDFWPAEDYHQD